MMTKTDVEKIIKEALERDDHYILISIRGENVDVSISPNTKTKPVWKVYKESSSDVLGRRNRYVCSECGGATTRPTPYCPYCGEELAFEED